ncbi:hypothetical protein GCM10023085_02800 [Actinomadura viridis]|uniref:Uncharacterized protein (TIGR02271 family) n=1 Tax=Actinomadura viridis TaxID=58110 RepID=A0A931GKP4_9ACTN|nr:PRC and DUF2382 domain-containing protein [Actinomadura viridis]MBG6091098.1 uncharacterized protein (TIGR02271 family) [Actinomadura viridis]
MQTKTDFKDLMDREVTDRFGHRVGTVKQVYLNDVSGEPEWVRVHMGRFGAKESFVPLAESRRTEDAVQVPFDKDKVKRAPRIEADQHLSREQAARLYRYYGLRAPVGRQTTPGRPGPVRERARPAGEGERDRRAREQAPGTDAAARTDAARPDARPKPETLRTAHGKVAGERGVKGTAAAAPERGERAVREPAAPGGRDATSLADEGMIEMTLSEERLRVGTERCAAERVRLRKVVEVERVERTVPVYREELRIEREPIPEGEARSAASGGTGIGEYEREFILHEERPVVSKETVAVERVRVRAERVAREEIVHEEVRKERIDVAHDEDGTAPRAPMVQEKRGRRL